MTVSFSCTGLISSYSIVGSPSHGSLGTIDQSNGTVTYIPDSGYVGSDSFTYEACNNQFQPPCSQATANITIVPPPNCSNVSASTSANQAVTVSFSCTGSPSSYVIDTQPLHGTLGQIDPVNGSVVYTPDAGYTGPDSFTYSGCDGTVCSNAATANLVVNGTAPPVCSNVSASTPVDTMVTVSIPCTNHPTNYVILAPGSAHGTPGLSGPVSSESASYTPNAGYIGSDSFSYRACNLGGCSTATVTITVIGPPPPLPERVIKPALEAIVTSLLGPSHPVKFGQAAILKVFLKRSSVIWRAGQPAFLQLTITDPPSLDTGASPAAARRFRKVTLLFQAHPGKNVIHIRKVKGHFLSAGALQDHDPRALGQATRPRPHRQAQNRQLESPRATAERLSVGTMALRRYFRLRRASIRGDQRQTGVSQRTRLGTLLGCSG